MDEFQSWLIHLFNIVWRLGTVPLDWQTEITVPVLKGARSSFRGISLLNPPWEGLCQHTREEGLSVGQTLNLGGIMQIPQNTGPALQPHMDTEGFMGVCQTNRHVFCGLLCPWGVLRSMGCRAC